MPAFASLAERCKERVPYEQEKKTELLRAEVNAEFDAAFDDPELKRFEELLGEATKI